MGTSTPDHLVDGETPSVNRFDDLYSQYSSLLLESNKLSERIAGFRALLDEERKRLVIPCKCGADNIVGNIELIEESFGGWFSHSDDEYKYNKKVCFVCCGCAEVLQPPPEDIVHFPNGFRWYVKVVHEWNSDRQRPSPRVHELLAPSFEREKKRH